MCVAHTSRFFKMRRVHTLFTVLMGETGSPLLNIRVRNTPLTDSVTKKTSRLSWMILCVGNYRTCCTHTEGEHVCVEVAARDGSRLLLDERPPEQDRKRLWSFTDGVKAGVKSGAKDEKSTVTFYLFFHRIFVFAIMAGRLFKNGGYITSFFNSGRH